MDDFILEILIRIWLIFIATAFGAVACGIAAVILIIVYCGYRRRWQKIAAIVCGVVALLCVTVMAAMLGQRGG